MATDEILLLTGASGGLGLEIAEHFLKAGHRKLALQYRNHSEKLKALLLKFELPFEDHLFKADLTQESELVSLRTGIESKLGKVQNLVNLAGSSSNAMSWKLSLAEFQNVINGNLTATFLSCREFIPAMRENTKGRIINVSSIVAYSGLVGASHYCAAKAGIVGLTKALALELANKKVSVNALALGYFNRGLIDSVPQEIQDAVKKKIPHGRFGTTEEIFAALDYLLDERAGYMTGQVLHLNGGLYL